MAAHQDDDIEHEERLCGRCGVRAPQTSTAHSLIGQNHGWRILRMTDARGGMNIDWRCPSCWKRERRGR